MLGLRAFTQGGHARARARPQKPPFRRKLLFEALEPRLLLSADLNPVEQQAEAPLVQNFELETQVNMAAVLQQQPAPRHIVFLDRSLSEYQSQLGNAEVVLLDASRDGVTQITDFLDGQSDVSSLHLVGHGSADGATLGSAKLGASTLDSYADQLAQWSEALTSDADILLYGCSVGVDQGFLGNLAGVTGADVAASIDATGNGDWDLEAASGAIEAAPFVLTYEGLLDATLSGDPDWVAQGPEVAVPGPEGVLSEAPPVVADGGQAQGPALSDTLLAGISGSLVNGLDAQGNPLAGAINAVAVSPTDPNTIFIGAVNGGVWVTHNANATKDVDVNTVIDAQRATAPKKPVLESQGAGGGLEQKTYEYKITYYDSESKTESNASETLTVTVAAANSKVKLKDIAEGPDGTTHRFIYRREAGTDQFFRKIGEVHNADTPVKSTFEDLGAALTAANTARIQKVPFPHWQPVTDGWRSLSIMTLAFDVADPTLDPTTLLSAIGAGGVGVNPHPGGYDLVAVLGDGTAVNASFKDASRIEDIAAILEVQSGYLASGQAKLTLTVEAGKRLVLTDHTKPFVVTPLSGLGAADLGLTEEADAATGRTIAGRPLGAGLSADTRLADLNAGAGVRSRGDGLPDFTIHLNSGGPPFGVSLDGLVTVGDLLARLNAIGGGGKVEATIGTGPQANRIVLKDLTTFDSALEVQNPIGSSALVDLGFAGATVVNGVLKGADLAHRLPKGQTLYAGTGQSSSSTWGGAAIGILKSTDNGASWALKGANELAGLKVMSIVTTFDTDATGARVPVVLAATANILEAQGHEGGLFRSTNGGDTWQRVTAAQGLPAGAITDLKAVRDETRPTEKTVLFAAHIGAPTTYAGAGIYRSDDGGASWTLITKDGATNTVPDPLAAGGPAPFDFAARKPKRLQLAVHASGEGAAMKTALFVAFMGEDGTISRVFRTGDPLAVRPTWKFVADTPGSRDVDNGVEKFFGVFPGAGSGRHLAFFADTQNPNVVYLGGKTHPVLDGSINNPGWTARVFRLDASLDYSALGYIGNGAANLARGTQLTDDGALGPSPAIRAPGNANAAAAALAGGAAGDPEPLQAAALGNGEYKYKITYVDDGGHESNASDVFSVKIEGLAGADKTKIKLTGLPTGPADVVKRNIYRLKLDGSGYFLVGTLANRSAAAGFDAAVFVDNKLDQDLGAELAAGRASLATAGAGGNLSQGVYRYQVTYVDATGTESNPSEPIEVKVAANGDVTLNLPGGPQGTQTRKIYRTKHDGTTYYYLATVQSTQPNVYADSEADASLNRLARWSLAPDITNGGGTAMSAAQHSHASITTPIPDGTYRYKVSFVDRHGLESQLSGHIEFEVTGNNARRFVALSNIPLGPEGTVKRIVYRTSAGNTDDYRSVGEIDDNTTRTFSEAKQDGARGTPYHPRLFSGSAPHADSRFITMDAAGNLLHADDGGLYRLANPTGLANARYWESLIGDLNIAEVGGLDYDPLNDIIFIGTQDNGSQQQSAADATTWRLLVGGDGNTQQLGLKNPAAPDGSIRYHLGNNFQTFYRREYDAANNLIRSVYAPLTGLKDKDQFDDFKQNLPVAVNAVNPMKLALGWYYFYESSDGGATVTRIDDRAPYLPDKVSALAYGGREGGANKEQVLYVATTKQITVRDANGRWGAPVTVGTGTINQVVLDPENWKVAYAVDDRHVYVTTDGGAHWADITGVPGAAGSLPVSDLKTVAIAKVPAKDLRITLRDGSSFDVSLKDATTLEQIRSAIEVQSRTDATSALSKRVAVTFDSTTGKLSLKDSRAGAGAFTVTALYDSIAGADLGITGVAAAGDTITGGSLGVGLSDATLLATLNGGAGVRTFAGKDVLLVGGREGVFRAFNPIGTPGSADYGRAMVAPVSVATVVSPLGNNDLVFTAKGIGAGLDGVTVQLVDSGGAAPSVDYNRSAKTLIFKVKADTKANDIIQLAKDKETVDHDFAVTLDATEQGGNNGTGVVAPLLRAVGNAITSATHTVKVTSATLLKDLGPAGGVRIKGGGVADFEITLTDATQTFQVSLDGLAAAGTLADVVARIQEASKVDAGSAARVTASVNAEGKLVVTEVNLSGAGRLKIAAVNGSSAAADLGIWATAPLAKREQISGIALAARLSDDTRLDALNKGAGVRSLGGELAEIRLWLQNGNVVTISLAGATTVKELNARIEAATSAKVTLKAGSGANLNKLILADTSVGAESFLAGAVNGSLAVQDLGVAAGWASTFGGGKATLGAKATARVASDGAKNDLVFTALRPGTAYNDFTVTFVAKAAGSTEADKLTYNASAGTLEFLITEGTTKASDIKRLFENDAAARLDFKVDYEGTEAGNDGSGFVQAGATGTTAGGSEMLRWTEFGGELPNAPITKIEFASAGKSKAGKDIGDVLVIGTRGRGTYKLEDASGVLNQPSVLEVLGTGAANTISLRLSSEGQRRVEVYRDGSLVSSYAMSSIDSIAVHGMGGDDIIQIDTALRVPGGVFVDGGAGDNTLILPGAGGNSVLRLQSQGQAGSIVLGGTDIATLNVDFSQVAFLQPLARPDALAQARAGLSALAASNQLNAAFTRQSTALGSAAVTRVLDGSGFRTLQADGFPIRGAPVEADAGLGGGRSVIARLLESGLGEFRIEDIGSEAIPDFATLRDLLDGLDAIDGNVTLSEAGGVTRFDVGVVKAVSGTADIDVNALSGAVTLSGVVKMAADIDLHLVFGIDGEGFFIDAAAAGEPELKVSNLRVDGQLSAAGHLGLVDLALTGAQIDIDPAVSLALDIGDDAGRLRLQDFGGLLDALHIEATGNAAGADLTLSANATLGVAGHSLGTAPISLSWEDITDPLSITLGDMPLVETLQGQIADLLRSGAQQLDSVGDLLEGIPGLNQDLPLIGQSVADLLPLGTILQLGDAVADYLDDPDPSTPGVELATMRGLSDALAAALRSALGDNAQGGLASGPFSVDGGYFSDTNELRFDFTVDAGYSQGFTLDASDFGVDAAALGLDFETDLDIEAALTTAFSLGLDLSKLSTPGEAFFVRVSDPLTASVQVSAADLDLAIDLAGFASLGIEDGVFDLAALLALELADPDGDGRTTVAELTGTPFAELVTLSAQAELYAELPLTGDFLGFDVTKFGTPTIIISAPQLVAGQVPELVFNAPDITFNIFLDDPEVQQNILDVLDELRTDGFASVGFLDDDLPVIGKSINDLLGVAVGDLLDVHGAFQSYFDSHDAGGENFGERADLSGAIDWVIDYMIDHLQQQLQGEAQEGPFQMSGDFDLATQELRFDFALDLRHTEDLDFQIQDLLPEIDFVDFTGAADAELIARLTAGFGVAIDLGELFTSVQDAIAFTFSPLTVRARAARAQHQRRHLARRRLRERRRRRRRARPGVRGHARDRRPERRRRGDAARAAQRRLHRPGRPARLGFDRRHAAATDRNRRLRPDGLRPAGDPRHRRQLPHLRSRPHAEIPARAAGRRIRHPHHRGAARRPDGRARQPGPEDRRAGGRRRRGARLRAAGARRHHRRAVQDQRHARRVQPEGRGAAVLRRLQLHRGRFPVALRPAGGAERRRGARLAGRLRRAEQGLRQGQPLGLRFQAVLRRQRPDQGAARLRLPRRQPARRRPQRLRPHRRRLQRRRPARRDPLAHQPARRQLQRRRPARRAAQRRAGGRSDVPRREDRLARRHQHRFRRADLRPHHRLARRHRRPPHAAEPRRAGRAELPQGGPEPHRPRLLGLGSLRHRFLGRRPERRQFERRQPARRHPARREAAERQPERRARHRRRLHRRARRARPERPVQYAGQTRRTLNLADFNLRGFDFSGPRPERDFVRRRRPGRRRPARRAQFQRRRRAQPVRRRSARHFAPGRLIFQESICASPTSRASTSPGST